MSSATDELRRLLDKRGIEYRAYDEPDESIICTQWEACGFLWDADDREERIYLSADRLVTPEQAIAATLGTGTCKDLGGGPDEFGEWYFVCSECKCEFGYDNFACEFADGNDIGSPHYCPNCGRKVVEVGE